MALLDRLLGLLRRAAEPDPEVHEEGDGPSSRKGPVLVWARRITQASCLLLFLVLLLRTETPADTPPGEPIRVSGWVRLFLDLDPLAALSTVLATGALYRGLVWSLVVVVVTVVLGRVFCGWVCPLGTLNHVASWLSPGVRGGRRVKANRWRPAQRLKYYLLAGFLLASVAGTTQVGLLDPICLLVRSVGLSALPAANQTAKGGADGLYRTGSGALQRTADRLHDARTAVLPTTGAHYHHAWLIGVLFVVVLLLNRRVTRFWCRILCPLGALLGALSRWTWLGMRKDHEACTSCNLCMVHCQGADMPIGHERWRAPECHLCFNCEGVCPHDVLSFSMLSTRGAVQPSPDLTRRTLVGSAAAGALVLPLSRSSDLLGGGAGVNHDPRLIRPPGSVDEEAFLERCIKCGACMKVCPNNALHPTLFEAGLEGVWSPLLIPRIGYCEETCTLCGQVCPTGAIQQVVEADRRAAEGKPPIKLGTAFYDRGRCLPWAMATPCIVCEEWCPTSPKAIWVEEVEVRAPDGQVVQLQQPRVDPTRCIGCGACEHVCPVVDRPAVYVTSVGESRSRANRLLLRRG